jgi:S-adenosylmethionine decarboxylase
MNRDHWLLYLTSPNAQPLLPSDASLSSSFHLSLPSPGPLPSGGIHYDSTLEILMTHLSPSARAPFFIPEGAPEIGGHELGIKISEELGIDTLFPKEETVLDSFGFDPCGYSANGVVGSGSPHGPGSGSGLDAELGGGYYTIHVTPEEGWSYASFECNVPLPTTSSSTASASGSSRPTLPSLIKKVVSIFQPSRLSITLFVSTSPGSDSDTNWTAFGKDLLGIDGYDRKDRIGYEFDGYDLVFACFEKTGWVEEGLSVQGRQEESVKLLDKLTLED